MDKRARLNPTGRATGGVSTAAARAISLEIAMRPASRGHRDPLESANSVRANGNNPCKVYLEVEVDDEPVDCLLDTGSEVTNIPCSLVQGLPKRPIVSQIRSANGTLIEVLGEVDHRVMLKGEE